MVGRRVWLAPILEKKQKNEIEWIKSPQPILEDRERISRIWWEYQFRHCVQTRDYLLKEEDVTVQDGHAAPLMDWAKERLAKRREAVDWAGTEKRKELMGFWSKTNGKNIINFF